MHDEAWIWPDVARELRLLVEQLTPDEAKRIIQALVMVENEDYLAPTLAGHIRGYVERRDDEARERPRAC